MKLLLICILCISVRESLGCFWKKDLEEKFEKNDIFGPHWGDWSDFGPCSTNCGNGIQQRTRACIGGDACEGDFTEEMECEGPVSECEISNWGEWSEFSPCSSSCGLGFKERIRECPDEDDSYCEGDEYEQENCLGPLPIEDCKDDRMRNATLTDGKRMSESECSGKLVLEVGFDPTTIKIFETGKLDLEAGTLKSHGNCCWRATIKEMRSSKYSTEFTPGSEKSFHTRFTIRVKKTNCASMKSRFHKML